MQTGPHNEQGNSMNRRMRKITTYTLLCFSVAGLIMGFTFGGFVGNSPNQSAQSQTPVSTNPTITQRTPEATPSPKNTEVFLDPPQFADGDYTYEEKADGTASYTLSA